MGLLVEDDDYQNKTENKTKEYKLIADKNGKVNFPNEIRKKLGLREGAKLRFVAHKDRIELFPNIHSLSKLYIEPTSLCNLMCQTCVRNTWNELMGEMDIKTFDQIIEQLKVFNELQTVMFGGFGEPTFHKDILYMISRVKSLGIKAEMVSNGTLLDEVMVKGLFENKLNTLWISFDGSDEHTFKGIRKGANYNNVIENLKILKSLNRKSSHKIKVGIAVVAMKQNINGLSDLDKLAKTIGASMILISNVLPYSRDMVDQMLCYWSVAFNELPNSLAISLPLIDFNNSTKEPLFNLFKSNNNNVSIMNNLIGIKTPECKFIKERCTFIRWDGMVSPCMGLLHTNKTYPYTQNKFEREAKEYTLGNLSTKSLKDIWDSQEYMNFRDKVDAFEFSPCLKCGPCDFAENNTEDCFGNTFPTCGGCLWAQGVIQCP
ncbi:MAG: SPASM domain-containing protein [Clostridiaceae bacterium]|nr:SPASM domain-containing protein [Clostridiaceae bacterium]